jgi:hypothetical protein
MEKGNGEVDMKMVLANASCRGEKLVELVFMNHTSANKLKKAVKK